MVSRGKILEILRVDPNTGKVIPLYSQEVRIIQLIILESYKLPSLILTIQLTTISQVFGSIRSLIPFRLTGGSKDYIVVGSDSGECTFTISFKFRDKICSKHFWTSMKNVTFIISLRIKNAVFNVFLWFKIKKC